MSAADLAIAAATAAYLATLGVSLKIALTFAERLRLGPPTKPAAGQQPPAETDREKEGQPT